MKEFLNVFREIAIEVGTVMVYVRLFHYLVRTRESWEANAFAQELSTVTVVFYVKAVFDLWPIYSALITADIGESPGVIHGLFRMPTFIGACFVLPAIAVVIVARQVRLYKLQSEPELQLIWLANLSGITTCFATMPFQPYILKLAKGFAPN